MFVCAHGTLALTSSAPLRSQERSAVCEGRLAAEVPRPRAVGQRHASFGLPATLLIAWRSPPWGHADGLSSTAWSSTRRRRRPLRRQQALPMVSVRAYRHLRSTPDSLLTSSPAAAVYACVRWPPYVQALSCSWCFCARWASRRCTFTCSSRASCARSCGTERWRERGEASSARERLLPKVSMQIQF